MLEKAIDSDLLINNSARQSNTVISKEVKKERRVLTVSEAGIFYSYAEDVTVQVSLDCYQRASYCKFCAAE